MIPEIFRGQPVFVVAGGPSLRGFDWGLLKGKNTIAINRAYEKVPGATVLWWSDANFWRWHAAGLAAHAAPYKATLDWVYLDGELPDTVHRYKLTGARGYDPAPGHIRHGNNGAYAAMHLAAQCGAKLIIPLGLDLAYGPNKESHWHDGHGVQHFQKALTNTHLPFFDFMKPPLDERHVAVLNASPQSALRVWPRCSIAEGLVEYERAVVPAGI